MTRYAKPRAGSADSTSRAARAESRRRRLPPNARCTACNYAVPAALIAANAGTLPRGFLEAHHIARRGVDADFTVPLCSNCHRELTALQWDCGLFRDVPEDPLDRLLLWLANVLALLQLLVDKGRRELHALQVALRGRGLLVDTYSPHGEL